MFSRCMEEELQEYYKNGLSQFPKGSIFLQVTDMHKGYIFVLPEFEKTFKNVFKEEYMALNRYVNEKPIDKIVGEREYVGYIEYAYLPLYDCEIFDNNQNIQKRTCRRCKKVQKYEILWKERQIFYAFKSLDLIVYDWF